MAAEDRLADGPRPSGSGVPAWVSAAAVELRKSLPAGHSLRRASLRADSAGSLTASCSRRSVVTVTVTVVGQESDPTEGRLRVLTATVLSLTRLLRVTLVNFRVRVRRARVASGARAFKFAVLRARVATRPVTVTAGARASKSVQCLES